MGATDVDGSDATVEAGAMVVDGSDTTVAFITGTVAGTGAAGVGGFEGNCCVSGSGGAKILFSSGSGNDGQGTFPMLPPCNSSSGSRVERRLAFQWRASVNNLLGLLLTEVSSGSRRTNAD